ncbi:uncharacterized protein F5Z01DRAFT_670383 [Emericellopsis atlantica]|uniref:Core Histone H2A/H2B/H3 domain-containing protein n=1 Tax=Emericellopsis atlantica TaxID=2614577 RepID=A0A9P8CTB7_9HYPO|nr:uncharacterized protein F5Z01DRAFT_670383 [Emericellopsis atlantica]KAG9258673.1 hypothetical protein F5Z01DRAFT_670383 [Emericellopsis atlantica]
MPSGPTSPTNQDAPATGEASELVIPQEAFANLVNELVQNIASDKELTFDESAMHALQLTAERALRQWFEASSILAEAASRETLELEDVEVMREIAKIFGYKTL